ncbi:unnamed protein product [Clavelina lepadiformis]|uniref:Uncharacterized protein n=1 Tax=Clavelina lepadiformis TaxID=159417 RepID=A0ABP0FSC7_CLALP
MSNGKPDRVSLDRLKPSYTIDIDAPLPSSSSHQQNFSLQTQHPSPQSLPSTSARQQTIPPTVTASDSINSPAVIKTSPTGRKIIPPKRFSDYKHNMFFCLLLTCFFLFTSAAQVNLHLDSQQLLLCQRSHSLGLYTFDDDIHCQKQTPFSIHNCSATVFAPDLHLQKIPATVCTSQITSWSTIFFFFGSYQKSANTFDAHPPYKQECSSWNETKVSSHGPLILSNPAGYSTRNGVQYKFAWPTSASGTVTNDFLFHTTIYYNYVTDTMTSSLGSLASCSIKRGYCLTGNRMFIWRVPSHINCPPTKPLGSHKMILHYNSTSLYRVSLPDLGISVHHWRICSTRAKSCYGNHIHCDNNTLSFAITNVQRSTNSLFFVLTCQGVYLLKRHTLNSRDFLQPLTRNRTTLFRKFSLLSTKRTSSYIVNSRS